jgi:hypothetical protein
MPQRVRLKKETVKLGNKDVASSVKAIETQKVQPTRSLLSQKPKSTVKSLQEQIKTDIANQKKVEAEKVARDKAKAEADKRQQALKVTKNRSFLTTFADLFKVKRESLTSKSKEENISDAKTEIQRLKDSAEQKARDEAKAEIDAKKQENAADAETKLTNLQNRIDGLKKRFFSSMDSIFSPTIRRLVGDSNGEFAKIRAKDTKEKSEVMQMSENQHIRRAHDLNNKVNEALIKSDVPPPVRNRVEDPSFPAKVAERNALSVKNENVKVKTETDASTKAFDDAKKQKPPDDSDEVKKKANDAEEKAKKQKEAEEKAKKEKDEKDKADKADEAAKKLVKDDSDDVKKKANDAEEKAKKQKEAEEKAKKEKDEKDKADKADEAAKKLANDDSDNVKKKADDAEEKAKKEKEANEKAKKEKDEKDKSDKADEAAQRNKGDDSDDVKKKADDAEEKAKKEKDADEKAKKEKDEKDKADKADEAAKKEKPPDDSDEVKKKADDAEEKAKKEKDADEKAKKEKDEKDKADKADEAAKKQKPPDDSDDVKKKADDAEEKAKKEKDADEKAKKEKDEKDKADKADEAAKKNKGDDSDDVKKKADDAEEKAKKEKDADEKAKKEKDEKDKADKADEEAKKQKPPDDSENVKKKADEEARKQKDEDERIKRENSKESRLKDILSNLLGLLGLIGLGINLSNIFGPGNTSEERCTLNPNDPSCNPTPRCPGPTCPIGCPFGPGCTSGPPIIFPVSPRVINTPIAARIPEAAKAKAPAPAKEEPDENDLSYMIFTLQSEPSTDLKFTLESNSDDLQFDEDDDSSATIITFPKSTWDEPITVPFYITLDSNVNSEEYSQLPLEKAYKSLTKVKSGPKVSVSKKSLDTYGPTQKDIDNHEARIRYLLNDDDTFENSIQEVEDRILMKKRMRLLENQGKINFEPLRVRQYGGDIEPVYDESDYKLYKEDVEPTYDEKEYSQYNGGDIEPVYNDSDYILYKKEEEPEPTYNKKDYSQYDGGDYIEPVYDESDYKLYKEEVEPTYDEKEYSQYYGGDYIEPVYDESDYKLYKEEEEYP